MEIIEEVAVAPATEEVATPSCASCGSTQLANHSKTPLCQPCRELYIKYPVPLWIKAFGGLIVVVLLFSLFTLPKNIQTGVLYKRGKDAAEQRKYFTAAKAFRSVLEKEPQYTEAQCRLLIASFYNGDLATTINLFGLLENKEVEDQKLFSEITQLLNDMEPYLPGDSFNHFVEASGLMADSISPTAYYTYLATHPNDVFANAQFARVLLDKQDYTSADSLLNQTLQFDPNYQPALTLKIPIKRELDQFDSAMHYANRLLAINTEYTYAHGAIVRVLLRQKKDKEALQMAQKLHSIYDNDEYILSSLTLAYHFNNDMKNRDLLLQQAANDSSMASTFSYVKDVISGKEKFRTN